MDGEPRSERSLSNSSGSSLEDFDSFPVKRVNYDKAHVLILPALLKDVERSEDGDGDGKHGQYVSYSQKALGIKHHAVTLGMYVSEPSGDVVTCDGNAVENPTTCGDHLSVNSFGSVDRVVKLDGNAVENPSGEQTTCGENLLVNSLGGVGSNSSTKNSMQHQNEVRLVSSTIAMPELETNTMQNSYTTNALQHEVKSALSASNTISSTTNVLQHETKSALSASSPISSTTNAPGHDEISTILSPVPTDTTNHESNPKRMRIVSQEDRVISSSVISSLPLSSRVDRTSNSSNVAKVSPYLHRKNFTESVQKFSGGIFGDAFEDSWNEECKSDVDKTAAEHEAKVSPV